MSTDQTQSPPTAPVRRGYLFIPHSNSNRAQRRGLCGVVFNPKTGRREWRNHTSIQVIRHPEGGPLPHTPFTGRKNKYVPHVGAKQLAKIS